ncbi:MAG TPA: class I SAM-dependent methyltransferase [Thermoleophilaceae bacterium]
MCSSAVAHQVESSSGATQAEAMMERVFEACIAAMDVATVHVGRKLGLYEALRDHGPLTSVELAERTGTDERYAREWLEHQAVGSFIEVDDVAAEAQRRRYSIPAGHAEALLDHTSPASIGPFAQYVVGQTMSIDRVIDAFRTGDGVPWDAYPECRLGQAEVNRAMFTHEIGSWIEALPEVHRSFEAHGGRVADVACGGGWSSIELARTYPKVSVDGYDLDAPSIELAERNLAGSGVEDRVRFHARDGAEASEDAEGYDLVTIFEAVHDMSNPVEVLASVRRMLAPGGVVLVADEGVAEEFTAPGDDTERLMYGFSVLSCLPVGRADDPSAATGTPMRPSTLAAYADEAGFARVDVLDVDNELWRFYRLTP